MEGVGRIPRGSRQSVAGGVCFPTAWLCSGSTQSMSQADIHEKETHTSIETDS